MLVCSYLARNAWSLKAEPKTVKLQQHTLPKSGRLVVVLQVPAYRMFTALAAREWFALEVCQHTEVMAHVCAAQSESGDLSMWRFGLLRILDASATAAAAGSALSQYRGQLHEAVSKGPYGVAGHTGLPADVEPQVAVASRAG